MGKLVWTAAALAGLMSGCAMEPRQMEPADAYGPPMRPISAELRDPGGLVLARANLDPLRDSVRVRLEAMGMRAGAYGVHVHTVGRCDPPDFASAGPHWNPTGQQHGKNNPKGTHLGDLPNLMVGTDGRGSLEYTIAGASTNRGRNALLDADGAAIMIHAAADDYLTDPSGNSGARIACGVFR